MTAPEPREALESLVRTNWTPPSAADAIMAALSIGRRIEKARGEGQWKVITFFGHTEYTGWVTEITQHGQLAYRIDFPEKVFGGDPLAYVTHSASSWFSDRPVTEAFVRKAWEERQERQRLRAEQEAEWARRQEQRALEAGDDNDRDEYAGEPF